MASHGGFIGVCIAAVFWYARHSKQSPFPIGDIIVSVVPPGLFLRKNCQFHQRRTMGAEPRRSRGAFCSPRLPGFFEGVARHPSQLYAATLEGLMYLCSSSNGDFGNPTSPKGLRGDLRENSLIAYCHCKDLSTNSFDEPDASLIMGMSRGQFYSLFLGFRAESDMVLIAE